jgi:hypothetical protein
MLHYMNEVDRFIIHADLHVRCCAHIAKAIHSPPTISFKYSSPALSVSLSLSALLLSKIIYLPPKWLGVFTMFGRDCKLLNSIMIWVMIYIVCLCKI